MIEYKCENCGNIVKRWAVKCFSCNEYNTMQEVSTGVVNTKAQKSGLKTNVAIAPSEKAQTLKEIKKKGIDRTPTGITEFDRVLGGGFVDGSVILLAGHPGSGKSTLCLRIAERMAELGKIVFYSSGEESVEQIGMRAERMQVTNENIFLVNETNIETILGHIDEIKPDFVIVDSLQTLASTEIEGLMGSISQSKAAAVTLTKLAKTNNITMVLINQVTKD